MGTLKTKAVQEQCVCSYQGTEEDKEFFIFFLPQENVVQYYTTKLLPACEKNKKLDLSLFFFVTQQTTPITSFLKQQSSLIP